MHNENLFSFLEELDKRYCSFEDHIICIRRGCNAGEMEESNVGVKNKFVKYLNGLKRD